MVKLAQYKHSVPDKDTSPLWTCDAVLTSNQHRIPSEEQASGKIFYIRSDKNCQTRLLDYYLMRPFSDQTNNMTERPWRVQIPRNIGPMLGQCWPPVADNGPTLSRLWMEVLRTPSWIFIVWHVDWIICNSRRYVCRKKLSGPNWVDCPLRRMSYSGNTVVWDVICRTLTSLLKRSYLSL